jgi:hypothetical protein
MGVTGNPNTNRAPTVFPVPCERERKKTCKERATSFLEESTES